MYSGNETTSNYPTQWALNPLAYQDVDASQVDWASLAQQWIQMKDAAPAAGAVPPPIPKQAKNVSPPESNEGGEAPMDIGNDTTANSVGLGQNQWNNSADSWPDAWNQWNWSGWPGGAGDMPEAVPTVPFPNYQVSTDIAGYTTAVPPASFNPGYWTADAAAAKSDPKSSDSKSRSSSRSDRRRTDRPSNSSTSRSRRIDRSDRGAAPMLLRVPPPALGPSSTLLQTSTIDAAKRRTLPAWIREGLEKMEREKQLKQEREDELRQLEIDRQQKKEDEEREMQRIRDQASAEGKPMMPAKSKFDTDSESENELNGVEKATEKERETSPANVASKPIHPPHTHTAEPTRHTHTTHTLTKVDPPQLIAIPKSREEVLQEVMLTVRRTLTEILLEVTNDEITAVCRDELARHRANAPASRAVEDKPRVITTLKGGLGLGIYDDSSASESEEDKSPRGRSNSPRDVGMSDAQLQEVIRRRKADFEKTCREIEAGIRRDEQRLAAMERLVESGERGKEREREKESAGVREKGRAHGEQSTDSSSQSRTPDVTSTPDDRGSEERDGETPPPNKNNFRSSLAHANPENPKKMTESSKNPERSRKNSVNSQDTPKHESRSSTTRDRKMQEKERDRISSKREVPKQTDRRLYKIKEKNDSDEESFRSDTDDSDDSKDSSDQSGTGSSSSGSSSSESESDSEIERTRKNKHSIKDKASPDAKHKDIKKEKVEEYKHKIDKDDFNIDSIKSSNYDKLDKYEKSHKKDIDEYDSYPEGYKKSNKQKSSRSRSKSYEVSNSLKNSKYNKLDEYDKSFKKYTDDYDFYPEDRKIDKKDKHSRSRSISYENRSEKKQSRRGSHGKGNIKDRSDSEIRNKRRKDNKYRHQSRERDGSRERYRDRSREKDRERSRERRRDRSRNRDRSLERHRDKSRERERSRESYRSRHVSKDRYRSEDRDKERYRSREKDRERDRRSKRSRSHHRSSYRY